MLPKGAWWFRNQAPAAVDEAELSQFARELFARLLDQLRDVDGRLEKIDARLVSICRTDGGRVDPRGERFGAGRPGLHHLKGNR